MTERHAAELRTAALWSITDEGLRRTLATLQQQLPALLAERDGATSADWEPPRPMRAGGEPLPDTVGAYRVGAVAVVPVLGALFQRAEWWHPYLSVSSYEAIAHDLAAAVAAPGVRAVVLDVDSPGGVVAGCHDLAQAIAALRAGDVPVTAYVSGDGCSAAYWLASAASQVLGGASAQVGCLGARLVLYDDTEWLARLGVREIELVSAETPRKRMDPATEEGRAQWQELVDAHGSLFLDDVAALRGVPRDQVASRYGAGHVLVGEAARAAGLLDAVQSFDALLATLVPPSPSTRSAMPQPTSRRAGRAAAQAPRAEFTAEQSVSATVDRSVAVAAGDTGTVVEVTDGRFYAVRFGEGDDSVYYWLREDELTAAETPPAEQPTEGSEDEEDDEEEPAARRAVRPVAAARAAERARIGAILALADRVPLATLLAAVQDPAATAQSVAHQALTTGQLRAPGAAHHGTPRLAQDEAAIAGRAPTPTGPGAGAPAVDPVVATIRRLAPSAVVRQPTQ